MQIHWNSLKAFQVDLETRTLPAPYRHQVRATLHRRSDGWEVDFSIRYLDREGLSEEELLEEGFSLDDDFAWQGELPQAWVDHAAYAVNITTFPKDQDAVEKLEPYVLITHLKEDGTKEIKIPAETGYWEYFLQEIMQAVYELAGLERPLEVSYREVSKGVDPVQVNLQASFAGREAAVFVQHGDREPVGRQAINWESVKDVMRLIYQYEFDVMRAKPNQPKKRGAYLFLGEGGWLPIPESLISTSKEEPNADPIKAWFANHIN